MSFKSRDLMIDVLPSHRFNDPARGLAMCGQITANTGKDEDDDDAEGGKCPQVTAVTTNDPTAVTRGGLNLALLQRQMRTALSAEAAGT
jgi:hypothetical protein